MNNILSWYVEHPFAMIPTVYLIMSLFAFIAYASDKRAAVRGEWRVPESTLHVLELLGGWPGALFAQKRLRHKSSKLSYQKTYGLEGDDRTFAIDYLQRPDIVLSMKDDASTNEYTYLFDSKYRVSTMDGKDASPRDAIDEMHRYRDAILYRRGDGSLQQPNREAIGAYVLFPGRSGDKSYEYTEKRAVENIGAIPLLPGTDGEAKLIEFIEDILAKRTPESHLSSDIPTRGTTVVVGEGFSEESIPTIDLKPNEWPQFDGEKSKYLKIPVGQVSKIPATLPALVRLKSNNKVELIIKILSPFGGDGSYKTYTVELTPSGYTD